MIIWVIFKSRAQYSAIGGFKLKTLEKDQRCNGIKVDSETSQEHQQRVFPIINEMKNLIRPRTMEDDFDYPRRTLGYLQSLVLMRTSII